MLKLALVLFIIALIAGALGFGGIAAGFAGAAKIIFYIAIVVFLAVLVMALLGVKIFT